MRSTCRDLVPVAGEDPAPGNELIAEDLENSSSSVAMQSVGMGEARMPEECWTHPAPGPYSILYTNFGGVLNSFSPVNGLK